MNDIEKALAEANERYASLERKFKALKFGYEQRGELLFATMELAEGLGALLGRSHGEKIAGIEQVLARMRNMLREAEIALEENRP